MKTIRDMMEIEDADHQKTKDIHILMIEESPLKREDLQKTETEDPQVTEKEDYLMEDTLQKTEDLVMTEDKELLRDTQTLEEVGDHLNKHITKAGAVQQILFKL